MFSDVISVVRKIVRALLAGDSPSQLATGFAIGMMIGLVPKANLIALSLCVLLFSLRCNKGMGLAAAIMFSFVGQWTDPWTHKLGSEALGLDGLQATYAYVLNLPLGPWLGFNNTVVAGSFLLGLYAVYPVYWIVRTICWAVKSSLSTRSRRRGSDSLGLGFDASSQSGAAT